MSQHTLTDMDDDAYDQIFEHFEEWRRLAQSTIVREEKPIKLWDSCYIDQKSKDGTRSKTKPRSRVRIKSKVSNKQNNTIPQTNHSAHNTNTKKRMRSTVKPKQCLPA